MRAEIIHYPKVPLWRRGAALGIDFLVVALVSGILGQSLAAVAFLFIVGWLALRVILVAKNQGQSLGRWAFDMKVVDAKLNGPPGLKELSIREGILGIAVLSALIGLLNLSPARPWSLLLFLPLGIDCSLAFADRMQRQAFHDQMGRTMMAQTRRGYSLDLKIKRLLADAQRRMK